MTHHPPLQFRQRARSFILGALCVFSLSPAALGQTVRPLLMEYSEKARGRLELVNDTLTPLNVVLEAKSFTVSDSGEISYQPLDSQIQLKLSAMSFRIPPQQSYYVFYEARAEVLPAWFVLYANFSGFPFKSASGMNIQLELPHTVYLLPKQKMEKSEIVLRHAQYSYRNKHVVVRVANLGDAFGRVLGAEVSGRKRRSTHNGFPVFPRSEREVEIPWEDEETLPDKLVLRFAKFTLEERVTATNE